MEQDYKILFELKQKSKVLNTLDVPEGYFENLVQKIGIKTFGKRNVYQVPVEYFESLSDVILQRVKKLNNSNEIQHELSQIAPFLNTISKENVFAIDKDYFSQIKTNRPVNEPKVISIWKGNWAKYLGAASLLLVLTTMLFKTNNKKFDPVIAATHQQSVKTNIVAEVKQLNDSDLIKSIAVEKGSDLSIDESEDFVLFNDVEENVKYLEEKDIESYLETSKFEEIEVSTNS